jgi:hypothetical protein
MTNEKFQKLALKKLKELEVGQKEQRKELKNIILKLNVGLKEILEMQEKNKESDLDIKMLKQLIES